MQALYFFTTMPNYSYLFAFLKGKNYFLCLNIMLHCFLTSQRGLDTFEYKNIKFLTFLKCCFYDSYPNKF